MKRKGFTIIEVVLVLAIAGLIFLMVFVALPNLQRTQRDTQRRNDLDRASTALTQYITNNSKLPNGSQAPFAVENGVGNVGAQGMAPWEAFAYNYLLAGGSDEFKDPNGNGYVLTALDCSATGVNCANQNQYLQASYRFGSGVTVTTGEGESATTTTSLDGVGIMVVANGARCGADMDTSVFEEVSAKRLYAIAMKLEGNGIYCVDNS